MRRESVPGRQVTQRWDHRLTLLARVIIVTAVLPGAPAAVAESGAARAGQPVRLQSVVDPNVALRLSSAGHDGVAASSGAPLFVHGDPRVAMSAHDVPVPALMNWSPEDSLWDGGFGLEGLSGAVHALVVDGDGVLFAGGEFTTAAGILVSGVARWDGTSWSALGSGMNAPVRDLAIGAGGVLYAGGDFTLAGGAAANYMASWDGSAWSSLGAGLNAPVSALAVDSNGNVYASENPPYGGWPPPVYRVMVWNGVTWSVLGSAMNNRIFALATSATGDVFAGGAFTSAGGVTANRIARWNGTSWSSLGAGVNSTVATLAVAGDGAVYAGGHFGTAGGQAAGYVARWNGTSWSALAGAGSPGSAVTELAVDGEGVVYAGWHFVYWDYNDRRGRVSRWNGAGWTDHGDEMNRSLDALALGPDGCLYSGGSFTVVGDVAANGVAQWRDGRWRPLLVGSVDGLNGTVSTILARVNICVGGEFSTAGAVEASAVAAWNGSAWSAMGAGLSRVVYSLAADAAGNIFAGRPTLVSKWNGSTWSSIGGPYGPSYALAVDHNGRLYAGGAFSWISSMPAGRIATWDGTTWSPLGSGTDGPIYSLAVDREGNAYAGGQFTVAGGVSAYCVARWNGTHWSNLGTGMNDGVLALAVDDSGILYAGGHFTRAGGVTANHIAKWDGAAWSALGEGLDGWVAALAVDDHGHVYAGGSFTTAGGAAAGRIARWDGATWSPLGSGLNGCVRALGFDAAGDLYVGGSFTSAGGKPSGFIAVWHHAPPGQDTAGEVPDLSSMLHAPVPNPFNPRTTLAFDLPQEARVKVAVYDLRGRLVRVLIEATLGRGQHETDWDGRDRCGMQMASGTYFARLEAGSRHETRALTLAR